MSSESKDFDCTKYDSPQCPKGDNVKVEQKKSTDSLHVAMVGCWGVYGWDKDITVNEYNLEKMLEKGLEKMLEKKELENQALKKITKSMKVVDKIEEVTNGEEHLKSILQKILNKAREEYTHAAGEEEKNNVVIKNFFKQSKEIYGQETVINGIKNLSEENNIDALFLAGDNVYSYNTPKKELVDLIKSVLSNDTDVGGNLPTKRGYKKNKDYSPQQIDKQLSEGFTKLVSGINSKTNIFLGIGNHDIQTCDDLNNQLNYKKKDPRYGLHGTYYNVVYTMDSYKVNFIIIDTNMFSEDFHCNGETYTPEQRKAQIEWVIRALEAGQCKYNIIIGHCPYIAHPHKDETVKIDDRTYTGIYNHQLRELFEAIKMKTRETEAFPKVQVYMCADEHNQQFLYNDEYEMCLVVAGSGGTALDRTINEKFDIPKTRSIWKSAVFGFVGFEFNNSNISITYYNSSLNDKHSNPNYEVDEDGKIPERDDDPTGRKQAE